jgi:phage shock protein E
MTIIYSKIIKIDLIYSYWKILFYFYQKFKMSFFNLFKKKQNMNEVQEYLEKGAIVIDVRTIEEYQEGHVDGSENIVLDTIEGSVEKIKAFEKPIITVCRSGGRSGMAMQMLMDEDIDVINGGPWQNVAQYINK